MNYRFYGADTVELAKKYGTPLYVMSEDFIVERCREIHESFLKKYENTYAVFAGKAFCTKEMCRILKREGLGLDVVSGGELYTALSVGFPADKIIFHGNNKTLSELNMAVESGVGRIVVDHDMELDIIQKIAEEAKIDASVLLRIAPGVDPHTHRYMVTGQADSKFGIPNKDAVLRHTVQKALSFNNIELKGFHFHVGSQLLDNASHLKSVDVLCTLFDKLNQWFDYWPHEINIGGGYGIKYTHEDQPEQLNAFISPIMHKITEFSEKSGKKRPAVIIEPGRWIVGEAGITLYTIGYIKRIPDIRTYVSVDGGMPDNPRPSLYQARYEAVIANKYGDPLTEKVTIAGRCCESGDVLIWDIEIPEPEPGDILAVKATGAYNYSMANNYNKLPFPPIVMLKKGKDRLIVERQTYEQLVSREL